MLSTLHGLPLGFAPTGARADERQVLLSILADPALTAGRAGQVIIGDKNYYGRNFEATLADGRTCLLRSARKGEPARPGAQFFKLLRQIIESVNDTFEGQLDLERHGGHTPAGATTRVLQRILNPHPGQAAAGGCELDITNRTRNAIQRSMRCLGERGFVLLNQCWRTLQHITASPSKIGDIAHAALVLTHFRARLHHMNSAEITSLQRADIRARPPKSEGSRRAHDRMLTPWPSANPKLPLPHCSCSSQGAEHLVRVLWTGRPCCCGGSRGG